MKRNVSQLYIDGILIDMDEVTNITLNMKSMFIREVSKMESNVTWSIVLPKTVRNRKALGFSDMVQRGVGFPYRFHEARYFRNGVEVIKGGKAALIEVSDSGFTLSLVWGLFPAFADLMSKGLTLNQLESNARILLNGHFVADTYAAAMAADYCYAEMDNERYEEKEDTSWKSGTGGTRTGGSHVGGRRGADDVIPTHPCVRVSWLLRLIKEQTGVEFRWEGESKDYIDTLILPVIKNKANELTYDGAFSGTVGSTTSFGYLRITMGSAFSAFKEAQGSVVSSITMESDASLFITVRCKWRYDARGIDFSRTNSIRGVHWISIQQPYIVLAVTRGGEVAEYVCGYSGRFMLMEDYLENGIFTGDMMGEGLVEVKKNDKITLELRSEGDDGSFLGSRLSFIGGTMTAAIGESDTVPVGGYYPLASNLPEIKVIDFVKFLAVLTGTFPVQRFESGVLRFVELSVLWDNIPNARDWTRRLIAPRGENSPQQMSFVSDYVQHNRYKWKEDDEVIGVYDGDLQVTNTTLDVEKVVMEFPFAATDGNNVPLYTRPETDSSSSSSSNMGGTRSGDAADDTSELQEEKKAEYDECEPRILRLVDNAGKAKAWFDIDMQAIFDDKYRDLVRTLQSLKVVKESIRLREMEVRDFDETIPVYLAQYGCYFAVTDIKSEDDGLSEVKMVQLIME